MLEYAELSGTLFSNTVELHSFELGVQLTLITILLMRYTSKEIGGIFLAIMIMSIFISAPIPEVEEKPWYFFTGIISMLAILEMYLVMKYNYIQTSLEGSTYSYKLGTKLKSRFWR